MYSFVNAVALSRSIGSQWTEIDLSDILVFDIYTKYTKVYLILSNPDIVGDVYVDMDVLKASYSTYQGTLNELFVELGNITLPTVSELPNLIVKYAKYSDAFRSEYKIDLTNIGTVVPEGYPHADLHDLVLDRPRYTTDMSLLHSHCLVSVNGYVHMTDTDGDKAYVYKGADTMRQSRTNQLGILSFLDIGSLTKTLIDPNRIIPQEPLGLLKDKIYFSVDEDLTNKSYILVLGGYLVFPEENVFWRNGDNTFALDINQIPYPERLCESNSYLDLSDLLLTDSPIDPALLNIDEIYSDDVLKRYMTLSQSFLVIVDTPNLVTNKIFLRHSNVPGSFTSYQDPSYPLIANYGKIAEYWKIQEGNQWSIRVVDSFIRNFVFTNQPIYQLHNVTDQLNPSMPFLMSKGFLLEIAGYQ